MSDASVPAKWRFPSLAVILCLCGWASLVFSIHDKLISSIVASVLGFMWTILIGIVSKVWSRTEKTIVELAGDWLDVRIRDVFSGYRKRYLHHIHSRFGASDVKGLVTQGPFSLAVEDIYVELAVSPMQASKVSAHPLQKSPPTRGRHDLWGFLRATKTGTQNFAVLGSPGSGKTTLLKHIAVVLAKHHGSFSGVRRIPVLLFIRDHAESIAADPGQSIIDVVNFSTKKMELPAPDGWFQREFRKGRCLIMFDGLGNL